MYLYVYEGFHGGADRQQKTEELIVRAAKCFAAEKNLEFGNLSWEICRADKGKPYFKESPVDFSVSHTDDLWVCLMSDRQQPLGVDIQGMKTARQARVAERYFTGDEKEYLRANGPDAFFEIWTRKEAYAKYTGKGITKELAEISTINNKAVKFIDFDIRAGVKGACCVENEGELCIRMI